MNSIFSILTLTKRNILIFLKNKAMLFFSFLSPLLIFLLYALFLGEIQTSSIQSMLEGEVAGVTRGAIKGIADAWMISGVLGIMTLSVALNTMFVSIADKEKGAFNDFLSSPVKPYVYLLAYFLSSLALTFSFCLIMLLLGMLYLSLASAVTLSLVAFFETVGILFLSCLFAVLFLSIIMGLFRSNASASAFTGVFSAIIGFIVGAYMPLGLMPNAFQVIAALFPATQATALLRTIFINSAILPINLTEQASAQIHALYTINPSLMNIQMTHIFMYVYLSLAIALSLVAYLLFFRFKKRK